MIKRGSVPSRWTRSCGFIREEEPPSPSHRLTSSHSLPAIAENRRSESRKLSLLIRGELDWIVMKSLEKERKRRYATANEFAADIERYLNGEPVSASPPSVIYRLRKTCRRHWVMITTSAVVLAAVLVGSVTSSYLAVQATNARNALAVVVEDKEELIAELESALEKEKELIQDVEDQRDKAELERQRRGSRGADCTTGENQSLGKAPAFPPIPLRSTNELRRRGLA